MTAAPDLPLLIVGAGRHASSLIGTLKRLGWPILGLTDADPSRHGGRVLGVPVLGGDEIVAAHSPAAVALVNGVASEDVPVVRRRIYEWFVADGYRFPAVLDPTAIIGEAVNIGPATQVLAGAVIQPGTSIGANCVINTRAVVDHDCRIGDHVHVAPGAVLSGFVTVENMVHVGAGAVIRNNLRIGAGVLIALGAAVVEDVAPGQAVGGVPAKPLRRKS